MLPYMKIKHLTQLREMLSKALSGQTNLSKSFQSFFIDTMELILTRTAQLHPDGEVRTFARKQVPPELQEGL